MKPRNNPVIKSAYDDQLRDEFSAKRSRYEGAMAFFNIEKKRAMGGWELEYNESILEITSYSMRQSNIKIVVSKETVSDGIVFIFPTNVLGEFKKKFDSEIKAYDINVFLDPRKQTHIYIPKDNKPVFDNIVEFMTQAYAIQRAFSDSLRAITDRVWWNEDLSCSPTPIVVDV